MSSKLGSIQVSRHDMANQAVKAKSRLLDFDQYFDTAIELTVAWAVCAIHFIQCDRLCFSITVGCG